MRVVHLISCFHVCWGLIMGGQGQLHQGNSLYDFARTRSRAWRRHEYGACKYQKKEPLATGTTAIMVCNYLSVVRGLFHKHYSSGRWLCISIYIHIFACDYSSTDFSGGLTKRVNTTIIFHMDVIIYPCYNPNPCAYFIIPYRGTHWHDFKMPHHWPKRGYDHKKVQWCATINFSECTITDIY